MTTLHQPDEPGLGDLLQALRAARLPVAAREVLRLRSAFRLGPQLGQDRTSIDQLRRLLAAALVHSPEEQAVFEPIFKSWRERWENWEWKQELRRSPAPQPIQTDLDSPEEGDRTSEPENGSRIEPALPATFDSPQNRERTSEPEGTSSTTPGPRDSQRSLRNVRRWPPIRWHRIGAAVALITLIGSAVAYRIWTSLPEPSPPQRRPAAAEAIRPEADLQIGAFQLVTRGGGMTPILEILPTRKPDPRAILLGFLTAGLFLTASFLLWSFARKLRGQEPLTPPLLPGPPKLPYLPLLKRGYDLLDTEAARTLIWAVDRHQTAELTTEIDLARTVRQTARAGGIPELHFVPAFHLREVWLWVDGTAEDPALEEYAEEIAAALKEAGLPVRLAGFDGVPSELVWDEGQRSRPEELEGHRQNALVAVLTDGVVLQQYLSDTRSTSVRRLLNSLATWDRLTFVDGSQRGNLARFLPPSLPCIEPEALPFAFSLGKPVNSESRITDPGTLRTWEAALALAPRQPARTEAYALARELNLDVTPWAVPEAPDDVPAALRWFRNAVEVRSPESSKLDCALEYWEGRLAEEAQRREERGLLEAWKDRPAHRFLMMERAFLKLWRRTEANAAVAELARLAASDPRLDAEIRRRLRRHGNDGIDAEGRIPLPWRIQELTGRAREQLDTLGFSPGHGRLTAPSRLGLAIALLVGLGGTLFGQTSWERNLDTELAAVFNCEREVWEHMATGMRFVRVCAGEFRMGSDRDPQANSDETPAHIVELSTFWIGETEVTNTQYRMWRPDHKPSEAGELPAVDIPWHDARAYCQWLESLEPEGHYDLPSEAQWEYAARGSDGRRYPWGNNEPTDTLAVFGKDLASPSATTGQRLAGAGPFGTLDQAGNVWEWVLDCYDSDLYEERSSSETIDPVIMDEARCLSGTTSVFRVLRGGSAWDEPEVLRSAFRLWDEPESRDGDFGFRCARGDPPT